MKHIPILFSTAMVQAILNGTKSQTRRIIKPQPIDNREVDGNFFEGGYKGYVKVDGHPNWKDQFVFEFAKWQPGDILWVRESFRSVEQEFGPPRYEYKGTEKISIYDPWKPSIHMPKSACRIFLKVKKVRCERLHEINEDDACREGIELIDHNCFKNYDESNPYQFLEDPVGSFQSLW